MLAEARAARSALPWNERTTRLYQTIFPQMTNWLPNAEAEQLLLEFRTELERLGHAWFRVSRAHSSPSHPLLPRPRLDRTAELKLAWNTLLAKISREAHAAMKDRRLSSLASSASLCNRSAISTPTARS